jgi:hypothetical protein
MSWFQGKPSSAGVKPAYVIVSPQTPTGLAAVAVSTSQINLTWSASSDPGGPGLKDYGVYRQGTGLLGYVTGLSLSDTGLTATTAYTYWVTARDTNLLESAPSSTATATTQSSGSGLVHGQSFTVTGSGFGTKSRGLAPLVNDVGAAAIGTLDSQWAAGTPTTSSLTNPTGNLVNRAVPFDPTGSAVGAPHPYVTNILACCSGGTALDALSGQDNGMVANFTRPTGDYVLYASTYYRADPAWTFNGGDDNYKTYSIQSQGFPYPGNNQYGYLSQAAGATSNVPATIQIVTDGPHEFNGSIFTAGFDGNPNVNGLGGHLSSFWGFSLSPWHAANGWIKQEVEIYCTSTPGISGGGRIELFENGNHGTSLYGYLGYTDRFAGTTARSFLFGGYNRDYGPTDGNNWRYWGGPIIFDITAGGMSSGAHVARVGVGNNASYNACTIYETQIPTAWAPGSVSFNFFKGKLVGGTTGYVFVQPEQGAVIPAGSATIAVSP